MPTGSRKDYYPFAGDRIEKRLATPAAISEPTFKRVAVVRAIGEGGDGKASAIAIAPRAQTERADARASGSHERYPRSCRRPKDLAPCRGSIP